MLKGCNLDNAYKTAEKIRQDINQINFDEIHPDIRCHISVGVVESHDNEDVDEILKRVDDLLYKAKELGKNQCVK